MAKSKEQIGPSQFDSELRKELIGYFRRLGTRDFKSQCVQERVNQLREWFFTEGETGQCLRFIAQSCLLQTRGSGNGKRHERFCDAVAATAEALLTWFDDEQIEVLDRLETARHAQHWRAQVIGWQGRNFQAHRMLARTLKPLPGLVNSLASELRAKNQQETASKEQKLLF